ncbi:MAG: T9SS type A sorting domain-containing protein, partial [Bacteroidota bacterium]
PYAYECLAISPDGKYLATINDGRSYLKVWDLSNFELMVDYPLHNPATFPNQTGKTRDMVFSENDPSEIIISGNFPTNDFHYHGFLKYDVVKNAIVPYPFAETGVGTIVLFDGEKRILSISSMFNEILNVDTEKLEYQFLQKWLEPGSWSKGIYSKKHDKFIGWISAYASSGTYNRGVSVIGDNEKKGVIYPNPTTNLAYIPLVCKSPEIHYEIFDFAGHILFKTELINPEIDQIEIDLTKYPNGTYFVKLYCGDIVKSYQIVKEG